MSDGDAWRGNWLVRLRERVRDRGYTSVTAFAEARPTASLAELADELGQDIAGVQIHKVLVDEAERNHKMARLVRGTLVRKFRDWLPQGWPASLDPDVEGGDRFKVAAALGGWHSYSPIPYRDPVKRAGDILMANPPPPGWYPKGPDDELLRMLIPDDEA
ncbi:MAG TPA: NUDIX hydrolase [Myxococcaceae bacterium]|nr:NUDIX hydrolase [Myxococcaceae bacterium]